MSNLNDSRGQPTPVTEADATSRYVIQLRTSPVPIDPRSVPRLDLFDLYSLHCDVRFENDVVRHALRLGYFKEVSTAKTVARYLSSYFDSAEIVQLTAAQYARSKRQLRFARCGHVCWTPCTTADRALAPASDSRCG